MSKDEFNYNEHYKTFYEAWEKTMSEVMEMWTKNPVLNHEDSDAVSDINPAKSYKEFYETWENSSSELLETWVNSPLFASSIGKAVERSAEFKKQFDEAVEKTLKSLRLPSKNDIDKVLASINNLEAKINDLTDIVDDLKPDKRTTQHKK